MLGSNQRPADYLLLRLSPTAEIKRCSLDCLIIHSRNCLDVRRTVSEGFLNSIEIKSCLLIAQSLKFLRLKVRIQSSQGVPAYSRIFILLFPINAPIVKEQESAALPTELTTQNLLERIIAKFFFKLRITNYELKLFIRNS